MECGVSIDFLLVYLRNERLVGVVGLIDSSVEPSNLCLEGVVANETGDKVGDVDINNGVVHQAVGSFDVEREDSVCILRSENHTFERKVDRAGTQNHSALILQLNRHFVVCRVNREGDVCAHRFEPIFYISLRRCVIVRLRSLDRDSSAG